jgi:hypothetical protein
VKPTFFKGIVLGAVTSMLMLAASMALAGSGVGGVFNLGVPNDVNATTNLHGTTAGPQLQINNASGAVGALAISANGNSTSPAISGGNTVGAGFRGVSTNSTGAQGLSTNGVGTSGQTASSTSAALRGVNTGGGPAGAFVVNSGVTPFTVNSSQKVVGLNSDQLDGNDASQFATQAELAALEARVEALEATLAAVSYDDTAKLLKVTGANVQLVDGTGDTGGTLNGLGNLIIGYNTDVGDTRTGSHNLVVGDLHTYSSYSSIVGGYDNAATGAASSVTGGQGNTASAFYSSITGGSSNQASGNSSSVTGGTSNTATGELASVTGGQNNTASGGVSSVNGGGYWTDEFGNVASGAFSSVTGGQDNLASGHAASITGGFGSVADSADQWLAGDLVTRTATISVPGGAAHNGAYATRTVERACPSGELLWGGGAFWAAEADDNNEQPLISSHINAALNGWTVRGGNDTGTDKTLIVQAVCLKP